MKCTTVWVKKQNEAASKLEKQLQHHAAQVPGFGRVSPRAVCLKHAIWYGMRGSHPIWTLHPHPDREAEKRSTPAMLSINALQKNKTALWKRFRGSIRTSSNPPECRVMKPHHGLFESVDSGRARENYQQPMLSVFRAYSSLLCRSLSEAIPERPVQSKRFNYRFYRDFIASLMAFWSLKSSERRLKSIPNSISAPQTVKNE